MPKSTIHRRRFIATGLATGLTGGLVGGLAGLTVVSPVPLLQRPAMAADLEMALAPRFIGDENAPITVAEYFSMTCGHCARFHTDTFPKIKREWIETGHMRFEFRDFPLDNLAVLAHAIARSVPPAAFADMINMMLVRQADWIRAEQPLLELQKMARIAGIGEAQFKRVIEDRDLLEGIVRIAQEGNTRFGINSTPSFVINDDAVIVGAVPYDEFTAHLDALKA